MPAIFIRLLPFLAAVKMVSAAPITFGVMGCGPYLPKDDPAAAFYLHQENVENKSRFLVHLGDLIPGALGNIITEPKAFRTLMQGKKDLLVKDNHIPTLIVVGDNEWNDTPDPVMAYQAWSETFMGLEKCFPNPPKLTMDPKIPSNFSFAMDGVLFVGIHLTGGRLHDAKEWAERLPADAAWIQQAMKSEAGKASRATVIFTQANPLILPKGEPDRFKTFLDPLRAAVAEYAKPTLFLHADGHKWIDDYPWAEKNLRRVQLDIWNTKFPTLQVTVAESGDTASIFQFNRRLKDPAWLYLKNEPATETPAPSK